MTNAPTDHSQATTPAWLAAMEILLNKTLVLDPLAQQRINALAGRSLAIHTQLPEVAITLTVQPDFLFLSTGCDPSASVYIQGSALTLARVLITSTGSALPIHQGVRMEGDLAFLQAIHQCVRDLDLDWEELLSRALGDTLAQPLGYIGRRLFQWSHQAANKLMQQTSAYWQEETNTHAHRDDMDDFSHQLYQARLAMDRLEQRVQLLSAERESVNETINATARENSTQIPG